MSVFYQRQLQLLMISSSTINPPIYLFFLLQSAITFIYLAQDQVQTDFEQIVLS